MTNAMILANTGKQFRETMTAAEYDERLVSIREQIIPYTDAKKPQKITQNGRTDYFGQCIGEVLRAIRKAGIDYLFREEQVVELLKYQPDAKVEWKPHWGCWEIWLPAA